MSYADVLCAHWLLLIGCALIPVAPFVAAFILGRAERRSQVKRMYRMRQQH